MNNKLFSSQQTNVIRLKLMLGCTECTGIDSDRPAATSGGSQWKTETKRPSRSMDCGVLPRRLARYIHRRSVSRLRCRIHNNGNKKNLNITIYNGRVYKGGRTTTISIDGSTVSQQQWMFLTEKLIVQDKVDERPGNFFARDYCKNQSRWCDSLWRTKASQPAAGLRRTRSRVWK
ncbi:hypothetical protein C0J52_00419 [Blattella germanica]|nr:hypothetical protein C0J52_00419 [Blattella germanica]